MKLLALMRENWMLESSSKMESTLRQRGQPWAKFFHLSRGEDGSRHQHDC